MSKKKLNMKGIVVVFLLLLVFPMHSIIAETEGSSSGPILVLDQAQEDGPFDQTFHSNIMLAQGFTPTKTPLTKIELKINKPRKTNDGIFVSIRKELNGSDLVSKIIDAEDIPFFTYWIEVDITDIDINPGEMYYIIVLTSTPSEAPYRWMFNYTEDTDPYENGTFYRSNDVGETWFPIETEFDFVDAAFRTYTYQTKVDMVCDGFLNWTANVSKNQSDPIQLTGSFTIQNQGTPFSQLNWEIVHWPGWGTWEFSQKNETNLTPEDGPTMVFINVEGPHSNLPDVYRGEIIIQNVDNENDTCYIDARLETPRHKDDTSCFSFFFDIVDSLLQPFETYWNLFSMLF